MMSEPRNFHNYIGGQWLAPGSGRYLENQNPADRRQTLGFFPDSNAGDVEQALSAAQAAQAGWSRTPAPRRAEILFRAGQLLTERKSEYAAAMTREMGKVRLEAEGDVQEAIDMLFFMAGEGRRLYGQTTPSELPDKICLTRRVPVGVAGLITPWNFPMAIPSWKSAPALLCGNTVVLKPSEDAPLSAVHWTQTLEAAGLPPGVLNLVMGRGETAGAALVRDARTRIISFTGSSDTGREVGREAAAGFKRCNLEMGGKNAILVLDDAPLELALEGALWGGFGTSGQRCTAASRIIVQKGILAGFLKLFVEQTRKLQIGNGLDPGVQIGPLVNAAQLEKVEHYARLGASEGARLATGGRRAVEGELRHGYFFQPTIFAEVEPNMRIAREEIFGPVVCVLACDGLEDGLAIANGTGYGLSASIYTHDVQKALRAQDALEAGIVYINAPTIGAEVHLPFGGVKQSGNGHRESGLATLDVYSDWKTVYMDYSGRLQRAQID